MGNNFPKSFLGKGEKKRSTNKQGPPSDHNIDTMFQNYNKKENKLEDGLTMFQSNYVFFAKNGGSKVNTSDSRVEKMRER